ncbi:L-2-hydroxyglutarate oxidase [Aeoliella mucimassa]|uniref:L-2-hydroxyglutarate oxidase LhgO n=1 Tax=Aeoliella mucimassa TaxID=2527972 RepID=A0A518ARU1_9BACT|nr:L-2-hydroxyglutarate oxidase [Aeoliella mucimassa]QDU57434.1 L-2-hydroxyglutarate oxidase LhgO [Aeoliella mucimassa]
MTERNIIIVGGGIVGLATALRLTERFPQLSVTVLEKESEIAQHQTGHNSGVLHSGIYYKPGSLKATNCRAGKLAMEAFCAEHEIAFDICGKVIVAVDESDLPALQNIYERGQANGVRCEMIGTERLAELEPHVQGVKAIHVPEAGIVDYVQVCQRMAEQIKLAGGNVVTSAEVTSVSKSGDQLVFGTKAGEFTADFAVNCAGLYCDRVAAIAGAVPSVKIIPFRGEYFELKPEAHGLVNNLIYPTPDPAFPFLGVHFTRMIGGGVECGPNAVLAFGREAYTRWQMNPKELAETLSFGGFRRLASKFWKTGMGEMWRSFSKQAFVSALQHLVPEIRSEHLVAAPAGIRAQAVRKDGQLVDDFLVEETEHFLHVLNAPSPAATASLNIGNLLVDRLADRL